jgi:hypothetical protein
MNELEIIRLANEIPCEGLPHFLGKLEEARLTALARLTPKAPTPTPPDVLLNIGEAAQKLGCSRDFLYRRELPFIRRLGRKRMYSQNGIEEYLRKQK